MHAPFPRTPCPNQRPNPAASILRALHPEIRLVLKQKPVRCTLLLILQWKMRVGKEAKWNIEPWAAPAGRSRPLVTAHGVSVAIGAPPMTKHRWLPCTGP